MSIRTRIMASIKPTLDRADASIIDLLSPEPNGKHRADNTPPKR